MSRKPYPSDVTDAEWAFLAPRLTLTREDAAKVGCDWRRSLPHDLPPWHAVYQQAVRWRRSGAFEAAAHDLRETLRLKEGKGATPAAAILDGRVLRSAPEGGHRAGYSGAKRTKGSKVHLAVDTLGGFLASFVTPADADGRKAVGEPAKRIQEATVDSVELACGDRGHTRLDTAQAAQEHDVTLEAVRLPEAKGASCRCLAGGSPSGPSRGQAGLGASPRPTRGSPRRWRASALCFCTLTLKALGPWLTDA